MATGPGRAARGASEAHGRLGDDGVPRGAGEVAQLDAAVAAAEGRRRLHQHHPAPRAAAGRVETPHAVRGARAGGVPGGLAGVGLPAVKGPAGPLRHPQRRLQQPPAPAPAGATVAGAGSLLPLKLRMRGGGGGGASSRVQSACGWAHDQRGDEWGRGRRRAGGSRGVEGLGRWRRRTSSMSVRSGPKSRCP